MGATFYAVAALMIAAGFVIAGWPLLRGRRIGAALLLAVALVAGGAGLYPLASNYRPESAAFQALITATDEAAARAAAARLSDELMARPHDFRGWRLLGRARLDLGEHADAAFALRQALRLAPGPDAELMLLLGQALSFGAQNRIPEEAADLFINAYQIAPGEPTAMWYAGLAYASRGRNLDAVTAWEALLAQSPPPEISRILREQIEVLRATAAPAGAEASSDAAQSAS